MKKILLGYVSQEGDVTEEDAKKLTHIHIAFGRLLPDGKLEAGVRKKVRMVPQLRRWNPDLRISLSIAPGRPEAFSVCSAREHLRETTAKNLADAMLAYDLDGVDLDWEFPCFPSNGCEATAADKPNFTLLCRAVRRHLDGIGTKHYLFSIAAGADRYYVESVELKQLVPCLDFICLMTYDLKCGFHALAGHHTALYSSRGDVFLNSCDQALRLFVQEGVPKEKLLMGAAFYSRKWECLEDRNNGFLQISRQGGTYGPDYDELRKSYIDKNGFVRYWDEEAKAPYLFDGSTFLSYDDRQSLRCKARYVKEKGYAGIFYWEHKCDGSKELLDALYEELKGQSVSPEAAGAEERAALPQAGAAPDMVEAGVHHYSLEEAYVWPAEAEVLRQLEWFQDQKFGLMIHWGPYSQLGVVESWAMSDADASWSRTEIDWETDADVFKRQYRDLNKTFCPVRFEPERWADAAADAGFRYLVFTTKHHDGFCMWDTRYSDYRITAPDCPFHTHKYADICGHLFEAMRKKGLGIAAYFSKADWHTDTYWTKKAFTSRNPDYDVKEDPERWEAFVTFTQNQVKELAARYGRLAALWFDAGWVCEKNGQDIRLGEMIDDIRRLQPWILSADRTVGGAYENYVTPEQCVPEQPLRIPWESCITLGTSFSFRYEDTYKSAREIACLLVDVVAKGGNLALNVGPQPDGRLPEGALKTMKELGAWLRLYGEAIYGTRICAPYQKDGFAFTRKEKEGLVYALRMYAEQAAPCESSLLVPYEGEICGVDCIGSQASITYERTKGGWLFTGLPEQEKAPIGLVFRIHQAAERSGI
ncbi:MAG: alpha-L-fucosidase [Clostridium sp.]|jgi:alpha-L-fucosidase|nr:alpha-L-fucosidase [Clostridium sp.]